MSAIDWDAFNDTEYFSHFVTDAKGNVIEVPLRKGNKDGALIDYLTFTFHKDAIIDHYRERLIGDNEYIQAASELVNEIFGFGISHQMPGKGKFFYQSYYHLGPRKAAYGTLHYGGQRDTVLIDINAVGCQAAKKGWELRLHSFLQTANRARITRIDVAVDFFSGEYTPEQALSDHAKGLFDRHNVRPKIETRGTAWNLEDQTGKTVYIGRRGSALYVRVYEKGRKLGDKESPWVRFEIEFRKHDSVIPFDILIYPGRYFAGAFPVCENVIKATACRVETNTKIVNLTFEQREFHARNQVGRFVRFLHDCGFPDSDIVKRLMGEPDKYPKGLSPCEYDCEAITAYYLHQQGFEPLNIDDYRLSLDEYMPGEDQILRVQREINEERRQQANRVIERSGHPLRYPQPQTD